MKPIILFLLLLQAILNVINLTMAAPPIIGDIFKCKTDSGTYQPNSPYKTELMSSLKELTGQNYVVKFHVFAVALCPGYLAPKDCTSCVNRTIPLLLQKCPNQKTAVAWRLTCMVRYKEHVYPDYDTWFTVHESSKTKVKDVKAFEKVTFASLVPKLMGDLGKNSRGKYYAYATQAYSPGQTVHMDMQCNLGTEVTDCNNCILSLHREMNNCCAGATAVVAVNPHCFMRYAHADFRIP